MKKFLPLIVIFIIILAFTTLTTTMTGEPNLMFVMQMFMSGFFIVFGLFKIIKWKGFVTAYKEYDVLAMRSTTYAYLYPLIEIALGIAYFTAWNLVFINIVTIIIMLISAYGVWLKLKKREEIPCACLGVVFKIPMTKVTLFEDLLMAIMALIMLFMLV